MKRTLGFALAAAVWAGIATRVCTVAEDGNPTKMPVEVRNARANSVQGNYTSGKAFDGVISDDSRWVSETSPAPAWLELDLESVQKLVGNHLHSGYHSANPIQDFVAQFWRAGDELVIRLEAPLNFDYARAVTGRVWVTSSSGDQETVTVTEDSPNASTFTGRIRIAPPPSRIFTDCSAVAAHSL